MSRKFLDDYLSFTMKERNAVIVLIILVVAIFLVPYWLPATDAKPPEVIMLSSAEDSSGKVAYTGDPQTRRYDQAGHFSSSHVTLPATKPFPFDPNVLSADGWQKLGIRPGTIGTIQRYISKGGRFKTGEDLYKIYGLKENEANRLIPFVKIPEEKPKKAEVLPFTSPSFTRARYEHKEILRPDPLDINKADSTDFESLPLIGSKLASRIIKFRESLGGFWSVDQLAEIYGLADSTFQRIRPLLKAGEMQPNKININNADWKRLAQHPYLKGKLAGIIVQYRKEHGEFQQINDLKNIDIITTDLLRKLSPYLSVN